MRRSAEVVIVGGGVVGASVAFHLLEAGVRDVLLLERAAAPGAGSTGRAMGGVRAQFANPLHIRMSLHSLDVFARFREICGVDSGYRPAGYLLVATAPEQMDRLREVRALQRAAGLEDVELVGPEEVARLAPVLRMDRVAGGSFRQGDGFIDPLALQRGFAGAARSRGARVRMGAPVEGVEVDGRGVAGVVAGGERIATRVLVNAAGPWAAQVAALAGADLPVRPLRRQIVVTHPLPDLPPGLPMVIDLSDGFHFRPELASGPPHRLRVAGPDPEEAWGLDPAFDARFAHAVLALARERAPGLGAPEADPARCTAGLYAVSPDHHAILGESPEVPGLFFANGFSGHGVMHSPATGLVLAELIAEGRCRSFPGAEALSPARFRSGALLHEPAVF